MAADAIESLVYDDCARSDSSLRQVWHFIPFVFYDIVCMTLGQRVGHGLSVIHLDTLLHTAQNENELAVRACRKSKSADRNGLPAASSACSEVDPVVLVRAFSGRLIIAAHYEVNHVFSLSHGDYFGCVSFEARFRSHYRIRMLVLVNLFLQCDFLQNIAPIRRKIPLHKSSSFVDLNQSFL